MRNLFFFLPFMLILVGFAQKSQVLWQQAMPISHRYATLCGRHAPSLFGPFILRFLQQIMAIAVPTKNGPGPGISQL